MFQLDEETIAKLLESICAEPSTALTLGRGAYGEITLRSTLDMVEYIYVLHRVGMCTPNDLLRECNDTLRAVSARIGKIVAMPCNDISPKATLTLTELIDVLHGTADEHYILMSFWERPTLPRFSPGSFLPESGRLFVLHGDPSGQNHFVRNEISAGQLVHGLFEDGEVASDAYNIFGPTERESSLLWKCK